MKKKDRIAQRNFRPNLEPLESKRLLSVSAHLVQDINIEESFRGPSLESLTIVGDQAFFVQRSVAGYSLWNTDGTVGGTKHLKHIPTQKPESNDEKFEGPQNLTEIGDDLYFTTLVADTQQLWKSDGTADGTIRVAEFELNPWFTRVAAIHNLQHLTEIGGQLYFTAYSPHFGNELWTSDGTPDGTLQIDDITAGPQGSNIVELVDGNGIPYVVIDRSILLATFRELWSLSGGQDSSSLVKQFHDQVVTGFTTLDDTLYFVAGDEDKGNALWRTDGTSVGTFPVKDIEIGNFRHDLNPLVNIDGRLYFSGDDGIHGSELWSSDGTEEGTSLFGKATKAQAHQE